MSTATYAPSITVGDITYVPAQDAPEPSLIKIVVLQRGWVVIGRTAPVQDSIYTLHDASVIRVWGTKKGLGELRTGPTKDTVLDKAGTVRFHALTVVLVVDVDEAAWADKL